MFKLNATILVLLIAFGISAFGLDHLNIQNVTFHKYTTEMTESQKVALLSDCTQQLETAKANLQKVKAMILTEKHCALVPGSLEDEHVEGYLKFIN